MISLYWPLDKVFVTQGFGLNPNVYRKFGLAGHGGIDLRTRFIDSPLAHRYVTAAQTGEIEDVRWDINGYGVHVRQRLPDGSLLIYAHLTKPYVQKGQVVNARYRIGLTGNTGFSSGPHLHFEFRAAPIDANNGFAGAVNPLPFMVK